MLIVKGRLKCHLEKDHIQLQTEDTEDQKHLLLLLDDTEIKAFNFSGNKETINYI